MFQFCDKIKVDDDRHLFESCKSNAHGRLELMISVQRYFYETDKENLYILVMESTSYMSKTVQML